MSNTDIRWKQRFSNFIKAFIKLEEAVLNVKETYGLGGDAKISQGTFLEDIMKEGVIQRFEYTHELAWNVMKDFLEYSGNSGIFGSRDATREAFAFDLISNGEVWMDMIQSRNRTSHTYNEETADAIFQKIVVEYYPEFCQFKIRMEALLNR